MARRGSPTDTRSASAGRGLLVVLLGAGLGAAAWGAWLGWDHTASYDVVSGKVESPYVTLQVLGCALTIGVATAVLAARTRAVPAAAGVSLGFWLPWTVDAVLSDDSGLALVGAVVLAVGLAVGTAVAAAVGIGVDLLLHRRHRRH